MVDTARALKVADRIKTVIAADLEHIVKDPDLGFVTITDVRVTGDLQHASVFYTVLGDGTQREHTGALLSRHLGRLRSHVGRQLGIRLTPSLEFIADAIPETAAHLDDLLRQARERDAAVAATAIGAVHAGDADPYRKPAVEPDDSAGTDPSAGTDDTAELDVSARTDPSAGASAPGTSDSSRTSVSGDVVR